MLYDRILKWGHWESFLDYAWKHADCAEQSGHLSPAAWADYAAGHEDEALIRLFEHATCPLHEIAENYFNALQSGQDHCLRCNKSFCDQTCDICGWDHAHAGKDPAIAMAINRQLNTQKVFSYLETCKLRFAIQQLNHETALSDESYKALEMEEQILTEELTAAREALLQKQQLKSMLEKKKAAQEEAIAEARAILRNRDSLYKTARYLRKTLRLAINLDWLQLTATARSPLTFPADLIMELQPDGITKKACCYIIIKKEDWQTAGRNKWRCDLTPKLKENVKRGIYNLQFSHLQQHEDNCRIEFVSKKLTIK